MLVLVLLLLLVLVLLVVLVLVLLLMLVLVLLLVLMRLMLRLMLRLLRLLLLLLLRLLLPRLALTCSLTRTGGHVVARPQAQQLQPRRPGRRRLPRLAPLPVGRGDVVHRGHFRGRQQPRKRRKRHGPALSEPGTGAARARLSDAGPAIGKLRRAVLHRRYIHNAPKPPVCGFLKSNFCCSPLSNLF